MIINWRQHPSVQSSSLPRSLSFSLSLSFCLSLSCFLAFLLLISLFKEVYFSLSHYWLLSSWRPRATWCRPHRSSPRRSSPRHLAVKYECHFRHYYRVSLYSNRRPCGTLRLNKSKQYANYRFSFPHSLIVLKKNKGQKYQRSYVCVHSFNCITVFRRRVRQS